MLSNRFMSLNVQIIYVLITGLQLVFVPNFLLTTFGFDETTEVWIKVLGVVVLTLALLYYGINKYGSNEVVNLSAWARFLAGAGFLFLVVSGQAKSTLILFSGIDIITAAWTMLELKKAKA